MLFVGQGKPFKSGNQHFWKFRANARKNQILIEQVLNGKNNLITKREKMTINFKTPDIKELKPRILVLGVGGAREMQ